jgi:hypothetical protein
VLKEAKVRICAIAKVMFDIGNLEPLNLSLFSSSVLTNLAENVDIIVDTLKYTEIV